MKPKPENISPHIPVAEGCPSQGGLYWLTGNIRRKLTLFVVIIVAMVIALFWVFSAYMLPHAYQNQIKIELAGALAIVESIINQEINSGGAALATGPGGTQLAPQVIDRLNQALDEGLFSLENRCLDISDGKGQNVLLSCKLAPRCLLHQSQSQGFLPQGQEAQNSEKNGEYVTQVRQNIREKQRLLYTKDSQIIMGVALDSAKISLLVSARQERMPQVVLVQKHLIVPLSFLVFFLATLAAWVFSHWFTSPLQRLSAASREMARGNYQVRVAGCGDDEIGDLARDFNLMAYEVGRSADLQRELLANVSHDLRTPLTLIKGYAETVRDLTADMPEKRTEQLNVIVDETDRLSGLVGSVLELSRMSSGAEKPEPVRFDLTQLCDEMAYRYETLCSQSGQYFEFKGEDGCEIYADPKLVERALDNLLGNAIKHVGEDGYIGLWVFKTAGGTVRAEVRDHGKGVAPQDLPHIFQRYYRSRDDAGKPGTGLGLAITKSIFDMQGFSFGVESSQGQGAVFWFEGKK